MPSAEELPDTTAMEADLRALNARFAQPQKTFGLDHRVQYLLEEAGEPTSRKPFYRLSQEPLILSNWDRVARLDFTMERAAEFASLLCGERVMPRSDPMWASGPAGHVVVFEAVYASRKWLDDLSHFRGLGLSPLADAITAYARTVIAHPFTGGNGRLARALFYGPLARAGVLTAPCLALGSVLDREREALARATIALGRGDGWREYAATLLESLGRGLALIRQDIETFNRGSTENVS